MSDVILSISRLLTVIAVLLYLWSGFFLWLRYKESSLFLRETYREDARTMALIGVMSATMGIIFKVFSLAI